MDSHDDIETLLEEGVAKIYTAFYRLRKSGQHQREYDSMGCILNMLNEDRAHMRSNFNIEI